MINELKEEVLGYSLISMRPDSLIEGLFQDIITITFQEINEYRNSIKDLIGAIKSTLFIKQGMLLGIALFDKSADVYEASRQIIESVRS